MTSYRVAPWLTAEYQKPISVDDLKKAITPVRACGDCLKCCKLLPVRTLEKGANEWCRHARLPGSQGGTGCAIYANRPDECQLWSCLWLLDDSFPDALQPNQSHVVFDMMTDQVRAIDTKGHAQLHEVVQLWCDPHYRDAHRAPAVREAMQLIAERVGLATLVRFGATEAFVVLAPVLGGGKWVEMRSSSQLGQVA